MTTYRNPHLQSGRIDLVELIEITIDDGVVWKTVHGARRYDRMGWNLLSGR